MAERFVYKTGTISVAHDASAVTGTGTAWGGRDRAGSQIIALPAGAAPVVVGIVAEVEPRGDYDDLSLPLVSPFHGATLTNVAYVIVDGPAIASGATQAAVFAKLAALLGQNAGLNFSDADNLDFSLVQNNSLILKEGTRTLSRWRNGVLEDIAAGIVGKRVKVVAATTGNIDIATGLNNGDAVDDVTVATGDAVLVWKQTDKSQNGIIIVGAVPARPPDFASFDSHVGALVAVNGGTVNGGYLFYCSVNEGGTLGTTAIEFGRITTLAGSDGEPGPPGPPGPATIEIGTVTTLNPGENADVENSGTPEHMVLDIKIPRGDPGLPGTGNVSAASAFVSDNRLIRSDGVAKEIQASGITVSDANAMSGVAGLALSSGTVTNVPTPSNSTDAANKAYVDSIADALDLMQLKTVLDCSANPNYPAANKGWAYPVSVAGKIGGASGKDVEVGDWAICFVDGSASGNQATVGANWYIWQANIFTTSAGLAMLGAANAAAQMALLAGTTPIWTGLHTFTANIALTQATASIEIGQVGAANTPYIDFHSAAFSNDYDVRIMASGGVNGVGTGGLTFTGGAFVFVGQAYTPVATVVDGANLSWVATQAQKAKVTLGGNRTMLAVGGVVEGATYFLWVIQDATGSRTITWTTSGAGSFDFGADGAPTLTTTANRADLLCFEAMTIGGTLKLRFAGIKKGFA